MRRDNRENKVQRFAVIMAAALLTASQANAADLKLLVGGAMTAPFREIGADKR